MIAPTVHRVTVNATHIDYQIVHSKRKTMALHVYPDGHVIVRAPLHLPDTQCHAFVQERAAWVLKHQARLRQRATEMPASAAIRQWVTGETIRYLGCEITLHIEAGARRITLEGDTLHIALPDPADSAAVERIVERWWRSEAENLFDERLRFWGVHLLPLGIPDPAFISIRRMRSRWGSCSSRGRVTLNLNLIHIEPDLIDYVVAHELCHLRELNHSSRFWALMTAAMPDWKARRRRLRGVHVGE